MENEEEATKATSSNSGSNEKGKQIIGRDNVRIATSENDFEVVANLRATAFYDDLTERQALPFPPRFTPTFHREFAQRERKALAERVVRPTSACAKCVCLVADDSGEHLVVERLRNSSSAVIGCLDVSIRHNPQSNSTRYQSEVAADANASDSINRYSNGPKTETFVYVDNVAVARRARRRGAAKALLEAASNEAISWGAREMFTHVHCENAAARRLYHAYGFRACVPDIEETSSTEQGEDGVATTTTSINNNGNRFGRLAGLVMIRAPLPLKRNNEDFPPSESCDCGFEMIEEIDECVCGKSGCKDPSKRLISL
jgi:ribosomal protein S18 acetylase RimI-like enzyme